MLEALFKPESVAVIGAAREPGKVGYQILKNLLESRYGGRIYPINPKAESILDIRCYSSLLDVNDPIDLGVVVVPSRVVPKVAEEAGAKKVKVLVVISAGFKEVGPAGARLEREVLAVCKKYGMRLVGPNVLGVIDTFTPLNASFAPEAPLKGNIAFLSQSGALCTAVLDWSLQEGIGFSKFVSLGNKADVEEADLLPILADDKDTRVILMYLEGIRDGRRFVDVVREVGQKKPVIVLKSGVTESGTRAVSSHTGSMAGSDLAYDIALKQAGVTRVRTTEELFDLAETFATQPVPDGPNVVIFTNAGGPGILATDACERQGLRLAPISSAMEQRLREKLPPTASFHNPVDVLGDATAERYGFALETVLSDQDVHSGLVILTPQAVTEPEKTADQIAKAKKRFPDKPLITAFVGGKTIEGAVKILSDSKIPSYPFPERAVYPLAALVRYGEYLRSSKLSYRPRLETNKPVVSRILQKVRRDRRVNLLATEAMEVVKAYGMNTVPTELATTEDQAAEIASRFGYPVVLKVESPQILHKTDIGAVKLNLNSSEEIRTSFNEILARTSRFMPAATILGVEVQKMMPPGKEMIIGVHRDVVFGPLIMFGLGGIYVNFLRDVAFRLAPMTVEDARNIVFETKAHTILRGVRGEQPSDIDSIMDTLLRVSELVTDFNVINEMDMNPLFVYEAGKGCVALDVKITIKP